MGGKGRTAAEGHWVIEKSEELGQPIYCKDAFTLEWKTVVASRWGRDYALVSTRIEKLCILTKLVKIRSDQRKPLIS